MSSSTLLQAPLPPPATPPSGAPAPGTAPVAGVAIGAPMTAREEARLIRDEMTSLRDQANAWRREARQGTTTVVAERPFGPTRAETRMLFSITLVALLAAVAIFYPIARAFARRLERGGRSVAIPSDAADRLQRIEHAVESIAIEVERISEAQRFTVKLMSKRTDEAARLVGEGPTPTY